jgi:hypothetical protein
MKCLKHSQDEWIPFLSRELDIGALDVEDSGAVMVLKEYRHNGTVPFQRGTLTP